MPVDPNLAVTLPVEPVVLGAIALGVLLVVAALIVFRKSRAKRALLAKWNDAADDLGIDLLANGSDIGPVAQGKVNSHIVTITPAHGKNKRKRNRETSYSVKFEAPEAPVFRLTKRVPGSSTATLDTGNRAFDAAVSVETDHPALLARFLTAPRRATIIRLLNLWPSTEITNRSARLNTAGVESDAETMVDAICYLVASAETFDRPTQVVTETVVAAPVAEPSAVTGPREAQAVHGEGDVLTVVRLDEQSVIRELFDSGLTHTDIDARFEQQYQGHEVTWSGEIVRVGVADESGVQRIAALIGSADGQDPASGRVVAITRISPEPVLSAGDVATFSGTLVNLDAEQRLFHLA